MTEAEYDQWKNLPHFIVNRLFRWAWDTGADSSRLRHPLDYDDLVQEGVIGLLEAWKRYDPDRGAKFITYAYASVLKRVLRFIDNNISLVKLHTYWRELDEGDPRAEKTRQMIWGTKFFSEMVNEHAFISGVEDARGGDPTYHVDEQDWVDTMLARVRSKVTAKEYRILMEYAKGATFSQMGEKRGITRQGMTKRYYLIVKKAMEAFDAEETEDPEEPPRA